ncbi:hypothetical protein O4H66_07815 [Comamonadaceae bacterium G21597-S1]|nr:hypothetical protein [Comamonadaceae bacterium G21597-S1]
MITVAFVAVLAALVLGWPATAGATDFSLSGFGTLGFAKSDKSYRYQRFVDDNGTFRRDSVAGVQLDAVFSPSVGATVQALASPSSNHDDQFDGTIAWAFVSWRPTNDWLVRVGKQRIPLYLYSQTYNVGTTYEFARLPMEMYSISPSNDFVGLSASKTWEMNRGELTLDGYWGTSDLDVRFWIRDGMPPNQGPTAIFRQLGVEGGGLVLTHKSAETTYKVGYSKVTVNEQNAASSYPATYPYVSIAPGVGYYQVNSMLPGPGIPTIDRYSYRTLTLGTDLQLGSGYRVIAEIARSLVTDTDLSTQSTRGYAAVLRKMDRWTPYLAYAYLKSSSGPLTLHERVNANRVPASVSGAAQINASQRAGADSILVYDQSSWSIGTSYALSPTSKIKAEWMRVRIGQVSSLVDAPPGSNIRNQSINVISLSYSLVF